jgi:hypothetical protein
MIHLKDFFQLIKRSFLIHTICFNAPNSLALGFVADDLSFILPQLIHSL